MKAKWSQIADLMKENSETISREFGMDFTFEKDSNSDKILVKTIRKNSIISGGEQEVVKTYASTILYPEEFYGPGVEIRIYSGILDSKIGRIEKVILPDDEPDEGQIVYDIGYLLEQAQAKEFQHLKIK